MKYKYNGKDVPLKNKNQDILFKNGTIYEVYPNQTFFTLVINKNTQILISGQVAGLLMKNSKAITPKDEVFDIDTDEVQKDLMVQKIEKIISDMIENLPPKKYLAANYDVLMNTFQEIDKNNDIYFRRPKKETKKSLGEKAAAENYFNNFKIPQYSQIIPVTPTGVPFTFIKSLEDCALEMLSDDSGLEDLDLIRQLDGLSILEMANKLQKKDIMGFYNKQLDTAVREKLPEKVWDFLINNDLSDIKDLEKKFGIQRPAKAKRK